MAPGARPFSRFVGVAAFAAGVCAFSGCGERDEAPQPMAATGPSAQPEAPSPPAVSGVAAPTERDAGAASTAAAAAQAASSSAAGGSASTVLLVQNLRSGDNFRVRSRAALALGRVRTAAAADALIAALEDSHPAVRAAAARSLGTGRHKRALPKLERLQKDDPDAPVRKAARAAIARLTPPKGPPKGPPKPAADEPAAGDGGDFTYYVHVGAPHSNVAGLGSAVLGRARSVAKGSVRFMPGVRLAPDSESAAAARGVLSKKGRHGFHIDLNVVSVEDDGAGGTRAVVEAMLQSYPGRDMRASVRGKATVPGKRGPDAQRQAVEGATRGALRSLPGVMQRVAR